MKRYLLLLSIFLIAFSGFAQTSFPDKWIGNWKGELLWFQGNNPEPKKFTMELRIGRTDSTHKFSWHLIYGLPTEDSRAYSLVAIDTSTGHWMIDEHNGILIDQYLVAGKMSGAFTVLNSTILNNYWLEHEKLHVEFYSISAQPVTTSGRGDKEVPSVKSYKVMGYQRAVLSKQ